METVKGLVGFESPPSGLEYFGFERSLLTDPPITRDL